MCPDVLVGYPKHQLHALPHLADLLPLRGHLPAISGSGSANRSIPERLTRVTLTPYILRKCMEPSVFPLISGLVTRNTGGNHRKILLLPVQFDFFSIKYGDGGGIFFRTDNKQLVAHIEYRFVVRNTYVSFVTDTGANKVASQKFFDFNQCFSADRLIAYLKGSSCGLWCASPSEFSGSLPLWSY